MVTPCAARHRRSEAAPSFLRQQRVDDRRHYNGDPRGAVTRGRAENARKVAVSAIVDGSRAGQHRGVQQRKIGDHAATSSQNPARARRSASGSKNIGMPFSSQSAQRGEREHRRQKYVAMDSGMTIASASGITPLRISTSSANAGHLLVAGVQPQTQRQPTRKPGTAEHAAAPAAQMDCGATSFAGDRAQRHDRHENGNFQNCRDSADHLDAAHVDVADQPQSRRRPSA